RPPGAREPGAHDAGPGAPRLPGEDGREADGRVTRVSVTPAGDALRFDVQVAEHDATTSHIVTVPRELLDGLGLSQADAEGLVRESFEFLLERERPTQILREF